MAVSQPPVAMAEGAPTTNERENPPEQSRPGRAESALPDIIALVASTVVAAASLYFWCQRTAYTELLSLGSTTPALEGLTAEDRLLVPLAVIGLTLIASLPAIGVGIGLRWARSRAWLAAFAIALAATHVMLVVDLVLYRSVGRHLRDLVGFIGLPRGTVAAGSLGPWIRLAAQTLVLSTATIWFSTLAASWLARRALPMVSHLVARILVAALFAALLLGALGPHALVQSWKHRMVTTLLYSSLPFDPVPGGTRSFSGANPTVEALQREMSATYGRLFPLVYGAKPVDSKVELVQEGARRPNVILIVGESLRTDAFTNERMPRMTKWAQDGLVLARHYASTNYSETGLFTLLYGRSPLVFHSTLDARVPPQMCETLRDNGYECALFTGHPKVWMRREDYLNEKTMDRIVHDDDGPWYEWDRKALRSAVTAANGSSGKPLFAIVLLMTTHFEYQYPPEYERHVPVSNSVWRVTQTAALGASDRVPQENRYLNAIAFLDDAVADAVAGLDPKRNLVVFTGDHGESFYEDGSFTHGHSFADVVTRVPFALVGPGVPPRRMPEMTFHADVVPTVLGLLGAHGSPAHGHGVDVLSTHEPRDSALFAHCPSRRDEANALLYVRGTRLHVRLGLEEPTVTIVGFENENARLVPTPTLSDERALELARAFEKQLERIRQ